MDLFSGENCIRREMQPERGNLYVADDIFACVHWKERLNAVIEGKP